MSKSGQAGFTLIEALVALVIAGMFLAVFGRAMSAAWSSTTAPADVVAALVLARDAAMGAPSETFGASRDRGFVIDRSIGPVEIVTKASRLAPALIDRPDDAQPKGEAQSTPAAMRLAGPKGIVQSVAGAPQPTLRHVAVMVATPAGRSLRFDLIRLDDVAP